MNKDESNSRVRIKKENMTRITFKQHTWSNQDPRIEWEEQMKYDEQKEKGNRWANLK